VRISQISGNQANVFARALTGKKHKNHQTKITQNVCRVGGSRYARTAGLGQNFPDATAK